MNCKGCIEIMPYASPYILDGKRGNNAFSYELRGESPHLTIPALAEWTIEDVKIGDSIVFEEIEDGVLKSCRGVRNFIQFQLTKFPHKPTVTIFDNHNHALYFWYEALSRGDISAWAELIHIDEHSDLWENENTIHSRELEKVWEFTNFSCNVGNYILPAKKNGIIDKVTRIENEYQVDEYRTYIPSDNSILNLDLDFFAPEMDFIAEEKKISLIRHFIPQVKCITIATSPFFIDQTLAIEKLRKIFAEIPH